MKKNVKQNKNSAINSWLDVWGQTDRINYISDEAEHLQSHKRYLRFGLLKKKKFGLLT